MQEEIDAALMRAAAQIETLQREVARMRPVVAAAVAAAAHATRERATYGHGDFGEPMCIRDGYMGEPYATDIVQAVLAYLGRAEPPNVAIEPRR